MNLPEISEKIRDHLTKQKALSLIVESRNVCAYRGMGGCMCAVGCLIDDAHYSPELEGKVANAPEVVSALNGSLGASYQVGEQPMLTRMLCVWQRYHDAYHIAGEEKYGYGAWLKDGVGSPDEFHEKVILPLLGSFA